MTPEELIGWHKHQITFLPDTDNVMKQHHLDAARCVERLRTERDALAAAMPSEGADAAIGYAAMKAERDALREFIDTTCGHIEKFEPDGRRIAATIKTMLERLDAARKE